MNIKEYILMILCIFCMQHQIQSQCFWDNNKGINTSLGSSINSFDWMVDDYFVYTKSNQTIPTPIKSPFSGMSNANDNIQVFIRQDNKDNKVSDGWELLIKNFGAPNDPYPFPTLILYNRHIGIIRVFVYVPDIPNFSKNTAKIELKFNYPNSNDRKESAVLTPLKSPQLALDNFQKKITSNVVQSASYFGGIFWMYADFPVAYDPCSCNHFTELSFRPSFINIEKVDIETSQKKENLMNNGGVGNFFSDISHPFDFFGKGLEAGEKKGVAVGKNVKDVSAFFNSIVLPNFDTKKTVQTIGPDDSEPFDIVIGSSIRIPGFIKETFGSAGTYLGLIEYFISGGNTSAMKTPIVNYKITGTITDSIPGQNTNLYTPGTPWFTSGFGNSLKSRPIYNNTLGVFGLVETPKSKRSLIKPDIPLPMTCRFKLKLDSDAALKYSINPSSNLIPISVTTSLVVEATFAQPFTDPKTPPIVSNSVIVNEEKVPETNAYYVYRKFIFSSPTLSFDCLKEYTLEGALPNSIMTKTTPKIQVNLVLKDPLTNKLYDIKSQYRLEQNNYNWSDIPQGSLMQIPLNINITDLTLTSDLTLRAWERIKISGNINTNGFKLVLIAGGAVDINPSALNSNIEMRIENPANCGDATPMPMDANSLKTFCTSNAYDPKAPLSLVINDDEERGKISTRNNQKVMSVNPNPFTHQLTLDYEVGEESTATIELSNALGQSIRTISKGKLDKGNYQEVIETSDLSSGIYFLSLRTDKGVEIKKVIKQ